MQKFLFLILLLGSFCSQASPALPITDKTIYQIYGDIYDDNGSTVINSEEEQKCQGNININILSVQNDQEVTIPIYMFMNLSEGSNDASATINVYHENIPFQLSGSALAIPKDALSKSMNLGSLDVNFSNEGAPITLETFPTIVAKAPGTTTLDFSCTTIISGHYDGWSWRWVSEKHATTIVHVAVTVIPYLNGSTTYSQDALEPSSNSNQSDFLTQHNAQNLPSNFTNPTDNSAASKSYPSLGSWWHSRPPGQRNAIIKVGIVAAAACFLYFCPPAWLVLEQASPYIGIACCIEFIDDLKNATAIF